MKYDTYTIEYNSNSDSYCVWGHIVGVASYCLYDKFNEYVEKYNWSKEETMDDYMKTMDDYMKLFNVRPLSVEIVSEQEAKRALFIELL